VGTGVGTTVRVSEVRVFGTGVGVGEGWAVFVHPGANRRMKIALATTTNNEDFIPSSSRGMNYKLRGNYLPLFYGEE
jgi:hypothetical protein